MKVGAVMSDEPPGARILLSGLDMLLSDLHLMMQVRDPAKTRFASGSDGHSRDQTCGLVPLRFTSRYVSRSSEMPLRSGCAVLPTNKPVYKSGI